MLTKLRTLASLYRQAGFRWSAFRVAYAFRLRTGLIRLQMPQYKWDDRPLETWLKKDIPSTPESYAQWRKQNSPKFFFDSFTLRPERSESSPSAVEGQWNKQTAIDEADRILSGEIKYFAHEFHKTGFPPSWDSAPGGVPAAEDGGLSQIENKHWSQISDDNVVARRAIALPDEATPTDKETASAKTKSASQRHVDIKYIWEPNRFAFVYTLVRAYSSSQDERCAEAFWKLILDWTEHNPPNTGHNWMDGQEISLRLMAWIFGYYQFSNSPSSTPQRIAQFTQYVAAQAERIYKNIDYAISTQSNHTISEAFGLWLVGLLFPELKDSNRYLSLGKKLLEQEATKQIFPDGSYSMYSLNYHRFILHIYLYMIRLSELNQSPISSLVLQKVESSITYLSHLIDPQTGQMPVYGSNDGALVLPLNNCDFTDYRPLLQLGSFIIKGERLFDSGEWDEDLFWLCGEKFTAKGATLAPHASAGESAKDNLNLGDLSVLRGDSFPDGGVYILRNINSKAVIRCTDYQSRPSHADQLQVDLWFGNQNIACDAGTYLYSGENMWRNGLAHTSVHNTVIVDNKDQMTMVSRFTWTNWSKGKVLKHDKDIWQGEHDGYKPVSHKRTVMMLDDDRCLVIDNLVANESHHYALHWLLNDFPFEQKENSVLLSLSGMKYKVQVGMAEGNGDFSLVRADPNSTRGWRSRYYGHKEPAISVMLEADQLSTCFWTFFGFESDSIELTGNVVKINSQTIELK